MKKILVMPGTVWQVPLMKKIKSMGYELHLINPEKIDGVYQIADYFYESDIFAYANNLSYCIKNAIDLVISDECDVAVPVVARLNERLNSESIGRDMAELFTNKFLMRKFCENQNINPIPYAMCNSKEEVVRFLEENGPKIIIKPINSNSSHGVFSIDSVSQIDECFDETKSFSRNCDAILAEKYIEGKEFTVDGIKTKNKHVTLAISEKDHYKHNENIANELYFSQNNPKYNYNMLRRLNDNLLEKTGLPFGLTHVEYKYHNGEFYLIEMAARGGGNLISAVIAPFMSGVDSYKYLIERSLDPTYDMEINYAEIDRDKRAILKFIDLNVKKGIIKEVKGLDYLKQEEKIVEYHLNFHIGDYVEQPICDSVRLGYFIVCADTPREYDRIMDNINKKLRICLQ